MRHVNAATLIVLAAVPAGALSAQAPQIVAHTVDMSSRQATLGLELSDGGTVRITLGRGLVRINEGEAGRYEVGGALEKAWRELLDQAAGLPTAELRSRLSAWQVAGLTGRDLALKQGIDRTIRTLPAGPPQPLGDPPRIETITPPQPPGASGFADRVREDVAQEIEQALADRQESVAAAVIAAQSAAITARAAQFGVRPAPARSIASVSTNFAGLLGVFVALACIAFGLVSFAPRQLEAVSDTINRSFVRSFFAGFFAQPLLLPVLGMIVVGLVLTVVGIVVLPVALVAFILAVATGLVGGYVAAAGSLGETVLRRRAAQGGLSFGITPYRSILVGLVGLLAIWTPFAAFAWVPVAGWILLAVAIVFTWIMATAGFGATILSRAGLRTTFARPGIPSFSGEYPWSTGELAAPRSREAE
jgi:hypothetical protein